MSERICACGRPAVCEGPQGVRCDDCCGHGGDGEERCGPIVLYGDRCLKCGLSSCDHNEDPVNNCPGSDGNPGAPNPDNYLRLSKWSGTK